MIKWWGQGLCPHRPQNRWIKVRIKRTWLCEEKKGNQNVLWVTWWWDKDHRKINRRGWKGRRKREMMDSIQKWFEFHFSQRKFVFSGSQFSQWQLHSWITKLTITALSKNIQSTPHYPANKSWKISKSPGCEEFKRYDKFLLNIYTVIQRTHLVMHFLLSVRWDHFPEFAWQAHVGDAKIPPSGDLTAKQRDTAGAWLRKMWCGENVDPTGRAG